MVRWRLGTMGYSYPDWQGPFYPSGCGQARWLPHYATHFDAVELNTTFHAVPTPERLRGWAGRVGNDFRFAVKTNRSITHDAPLAAAIKPMGEFVTVLRELGELLGPVLIQLPPTTSIQQFDALERLLGSLPKDMRFAVEFRHPSWVDDRVTALLSEHRAAWVGLDHLDHPDLRRLRGTAADFLYVRLVGRHDQFEYLGEEQVDVEPNLHRWHAAIRREVDRLGGGIREVWVLANNDYAGHAPGTLRRFARIAGITLPEASLLPTELF